MTLTPYCSYRKKTHTYIFENWFFKRIFFIANQFQNSTHKKYIFQSRSSSSATSSSASKPDPEDEEEEEEEEEISPRRLNRGTIFFGGKI